MLKEVDPKTIEGARARIANGVRSLVRPFMLTVPGIGAGIENFPGNFTLKELGREVSMDAYRVASVLNEKQVYPNGKSTQGRMTFADMDGNYWDVQWLSSRQQNPRIKRALRMAGHRAMEEGIRAGKNTLSSMKDRFAAEDRRLFVRRVANPGF